MGRAGAAQDVAARPGRRTLAPVPLSAPFQRYATQLLAVPPEQVTVVVVPPRPGASMADAVRRAGLMDTVREPAQERPGISLLPTALDSSSADFAREAGVSVAPYGRSGPTTQALSVVSSLNTKSGFRDIASTLGMRMPHGVVCRHPDLRGHVERMVKQHGEVVLKPDRSAGGGAEPRRGSGSWGCRPAMAGEGHRAPTNPRNRRQ